MNSLKFGGAEKQTVDLINNLDSTRFGMILCYISAEKILMEEVRQENLEGIYCLGKKNKFDISPLMRFLRIVKAVRPEMVVCINPFPSLYAHLVRLLSRVPFKIIVVMHTTIMRSRYEHLMAHFLFSHLAKRCEKVVFVCRNQMEYWLEHYGIDQAKSTYIYNGIDTERFTDRLTLSEKIDIRKRYSIDGTDFVICICAVLRPEKRHKDLIDAGKILVSRGLPVKIIVVGDGVDRELIEAHVHSSGLSKQVIMTGFQKDVRPFIAISDIFAVISISETFSIAILEAMAMGKCIVASDIGGASEQIIDGVNGFLFPAGDVEALAERLERAAAEELTIKMGRISRAIVSEKFSLAQMVTNYENLFFELISSKQTPASGEGVTGFDNGVRKSN